MYRTIMLSVFVVSMLTVFMVRAADIPQVEMGAKGYDKDLCIKQYTDNCIASICVTSSEIDCNGKCKASAQDKCEQQATE